MRFRKQLKNRYFAMRHGESEANVQEIILSDPKNGVSGFGLTRKGKQQVANSILANEELDENTLIYSSDFARTRETSEITRAILQAKPITFTKLLRERFFGDFEKTSNENYEVVWKHDRENSDHKFTNVESVNETLNRTRELIAALEIKHEGENILLVSHGDSLQILQTEFLQVPSSQHRQIQHLETAEIRELTS